MKCPKCEFETNEASCPRCGVVFNKLGRERPPRPEPAPSRPRPVPPPPSSEGVSLFNIVVLSVLLTSVSYYAWKWGWIKNPEPAPAVDESAPDAPPPVPREYVVEVPTRQPEPLILGGLRLRGRRRWIRLPLAFYKSKSNRAPKR